MSSYIQLSEFRDPEYLYKLMGSALIICEAWGQVVSKTSEYYNGYCFRRKEWDDEISVIRTSYVYDDEKISIEATDGYKRDYIVKITVKSIQTVVFNCEVSYNRLDTYRPGKWEQYLFAMKEDAVKAIRLRQSTILQKQKEIQKMKYEPIDDSDIF